MKRLIYILFIIIGCGVNEVDLEPFSCSAKNVEGGAIIACNDGSGAFIPNGEDSTIHTAIPLPVIDDCVVLSNGYYAVNEGSRLDIYNNDQCDANPNPNRREINNLSGGRIAWLSNSLYTIEGSQSAMILHILDF